MSKNVKRLNSIKVRPVRSKTETGTEQPRPELSSSELESIIKRAQANYEDFRVLRDMLDKHCDDLTDSSIMSVAKRLLLLDHILGYETEGYTREASMQLVGVIGSVLEDCADSLARRIGYVGTGKIADALYSSTAGE